MTKHVNDRRVGRMQNFLIVLLAFSSVFLFASLPLFGPLSDQSLIELGQERLQRETAASGSGVSDASPLAFPVRIVYTNGFARFGSDGLTTLSDEFERAGTYLSEALGSANNEIPIGESIFLSALRGEGLYFDFTATLPSEILSGLLGVDMPQTGLSGVRRILLCPAGENDAVLYAQDGNGQYRRFSTAVSSPALVDFLSAQGGSSADFAFLLGAPYARLSPYTLVLSSSAQRSILNVSYTLAGGEDAFLKRAEFNTHAENRFTESSGSVIVREVSSTMYLRPDGVVDYQGGEVSPDSIYFVPTAAEGSATLAEAASAAQTLVAALLQDLSGDAAFYLSKTQDEGNGRYEIAFDLMANGTPIRFSDGSHAVVVTIEGQHVAAFTMKARRYTVTEESSPLLPFALSAAIARVWDGAELIVAYVDAGGETAEPVWIAE